MSIQNSVSKFIERNPAIKQSLRLDLVNFSKLSRMILESEGLNENDFDAVLISLRRLKDKLKQNNIAAIRKIIDKTSSKIENKIAVIITDPHIHPKTVLELKEKAKNKQIMIIEGNSAKTIITSEDMIPFLEKRLKDNIIKIQKKQVKITLVSPENLESVPGVIAHIFSLLSENGINITETMSCFKDTILILNEKDLMKAMEILE